MYVCRIPLSPSVCVCVCVCGGGGGGGRGGGRGEGGGEGVSACLCVWVCVCVCCTHLFSFFPLAFVSVNDLFSWFFLVFVSEMRTIFVVVVVAVCFFLLYAFVFYVYCRVLTDVVVELMLNVLRCHWHIRDKLWPMPKHGSIRKVYACLAVTCHLHFWQNDRDFLRATVVTRGWNGYRNKSQHRKSTLEKKILPPFQQGFRTRDLSITSSAL